MKGKVQGTIKGNIVKVPMLSLANIRLLLVSVMLLKQLTIDQAVEQIKTSFLTEHVPQKVA
ncbi:hypothetical protein MBAV_003791 [Candidatus Magnetobacterium bavaricum]|uniref:Uncharacterized protein n=1 Tax=Candidatus Magnetobacterium bavaricum TaxID=29290 RepID=A0A0F3GQ35_9BACT|nr:hypothetical protein MBAV_003791 [Candidatus Magnetobacterium bavaricum]